MTKDQSEPHIVAIREDIENDFGKITEIDSIIHGEGTVFHVFVHGIPYESLEDLNDKWQHYDLIPMGDEPLLCIVTQPRNPKKYY